MRIDSKESTAIVAAEYSPNVALYCGGSTNGRFSRYYYSRFNDGITYTRRENINFNELFCEIKRNK